MKLTDFITDIGRPVAFYPGLRKITQSTTATLFLCQLIYWMGKGADPDGYIYKSSEEIEEETGLTYDEQRTARKKLVQLGFIEEHYARLEHQIRFRVIANAVNTSWASWQCPDGEGYNPTMANAINTSWPSWQCPDGEGHNPTMANAILPNSLNGTTETTTETTTEIIAEKSAKPEPHYEPCDDDGIEIPKKKPKKKPIPDGRSKTPAIIAFRRLTGHYPKSINYQDVIDILGEVPDEVKLAACYKEWCARGYNSNSIKWLTEWYKNGIPQRGGNKSEKAKALEWLEKENQEE